MALGRDNVDESSLTAAIPNAKKPLLRFIVAPLLTLAAVLVGGTWFIYSCSPLRQPPSNPTATKQVSTAMPMATPTESPGALLSELQSRWQHVLDNAHDSLADAWSLHNNRFDPTKTSRALSYTSAAILDFQQQAGLDYRLQKETTRLINCIGTAIEFLQPFPYSFDPDNFHPSNRQIASLNEAENERIIVIDGLLEVAEWLRLDTQGFRYEQKSPSR